MPRSSPLKCFGKSLRKLVGTRRAAVLAVDATQTRTNISGFSALSQRADTLRITMTAARKLHVVKHTVGIYFELDGAGTHALRDISVSHNQS